MKHAWHGWNKAITVLLAVAILALGLPLLSRPVLANGLSLRIDKWEVDRGSGVVSYDLTIAATDAGVPGAPCSAYAGRCRYLVEAVYRDPSGDRVQHVIASNYATNTFSIPFGGSVVMGETTHIKATLYDVYETPGVATWTQWATVSDPYRDGSIKVDVAQWNVDETTGGIDYDVTLTFDGAAQVNGPCFGIRCYYGLEAYYKDGTKQVLQHTLYGYECSGCWTATRRLTGMAAIRKEVTHLRAYLSPSDVQCPTPCSRESYEAWTSVSPPYPDGSIELDIAKWRKDASTRTVEYVLTMSFARAGQEDGPCSSRCYYDVEGWAGEGDSGYLAARLLSGECWSGCWSMTRRLTASAASMSAVTHLRAVVYPWPCSSPCSKQTYDTGMIEVSDYMYMNHDVAASAVALRPVLTRNPTFFCTRYLLRAGTHRLRSTLTDQYLACEAAVAATEYTVVSVLENMIDAGGGPTIEIVVGETMRPFPLPDPSPPPVRQDWKDETGCEQNIPEWSVEAAAGHIEHEHGYANASKAEESGWEHGAPDSYWDYGVPWPQLVWPHAMRFPAYPGSYVGSCERVIQYAVPIGFERIYGTSGVPDFRLTDIYTVVTDQEGGRLITAHPGRPGEDQ